MEFEHTDVGIDQAESDQRTNLYVCTILRLTVKLKNDKPRSCVVPTSQTFTFMGKRQRG